MTVHVTIDGFAMQARSGTTIRRAAAHAGIDIPTLCWSENMSPASTCRLCVVEIDGSRALVPSCSREVEDQMVITTNSERVRQNRKSILELLGSSVDLEWADSDLSSHLIEYDADLDKFASGGVGGEPKIQDDLYVRAYDRCVLCYKCVDACGEEAQHTFAIAVAGRGFSSQISTEFDVALPDSACVYCGNCIAVCPTGALTPVTEFLLREQGEWKPEEQAITETVCAFCGVGCNLELHVQDEKIVKVTSPNDHDITLGNLCIKGRFGWQHLD